MLPGEAVMFSDATWSAQQSEHPSEILSAHSPFMSFPPHSGKAKEENLHYRVWKTGLSRVLPDDPNLFSSHALSVRCGQSQPFAKPLGGRGMSHLVDPGAPPFFMSPSTMETTRDLEHHM